MSSQYPYKLPPVFRECASYCFIFKQTTKRSLAAIYESFGGYFDTYDQFKNYTELKAEVLASSCFINDGKGNFTRADLPAELQLAPVMSFTKASEPGTFIAGGNFYGVLPYEGRYDALLPTEFSFNKGTKPG